MFRNNSENVVKSNTNSEKKVLTDKNTNKKLSTKSVNTTFENKPEKYITEACTQTSFVIPVATVAEYTNQQQSLSKKMPEQESNQENSTVKKSSRNNRVEKIIEYEKKQHDKRIRELEKLAYMEKYSIFFNFNYKIMVNLSQINLDYMAKNCAK